MGSDTKRSRPQRRGIRFVYVEEIEVAGDKVDGPIWDEFVKSSRFDGRGSDDTWLGGGRPGIRYPQSGTKHGTNRHASITSIDFS